MDIHLVRQVRGSALSLSRVHIDVIDVFCRLMPFLLKYTEPQDPGVSQDDCRSTFC